MICLHTFSSSLITDLSSHQYANEQTSFFFFLSCSTGSPSTRWPFCAEVVSNRFQASSFGLLLLLLLLLLSERTVGNNRADARGVKGGGGGGVRPSCPYLCPPCKLAGSEPESSHKQGWEGLDSTAPSRTGLDRTGLGLRDRSHSSFMSKLDSRRLLFPKLGLNIFYLWKDKKKIHGFIYLR